MPLEGGRRVVEHRYFFVLGMHRSGTNWMCNVLNLHPEINCHGEYHLELLQAGVKNFTTVGWGLGSEPPLRAMTEDWFADFVRQALRTHIDRKPHATWLGDRTPRHLEPLLPDAPHFYIYRDGRDVTVSRVHQLLGADAVVNEPWRSMVRPLVRAFREDPQIFKKDPERLCAAPEWIRTLARQWTNSLRRDFEAARGMEAGKISGRVMLVRYETLHAEPETERNRMYRFLDLDPARADPLSGDTRTKPGLTEERPADLYRKGVTGDWQNYATDSFRSILKEEMGDLLIELGYADDLNW